MVVVTLVVVALAALGLYSATSTGDHVSVERQIRTTQRAIEDRVARLAQEQETVAVWDETIHYVTRPHRDLNWLHDNTGLWLHNIYGHDATFVLDGNDRPIYASLAGERAPTARFEEVRQDIRFMIDEVRGRRPEQSGPFDRHPGQVNAGREVLTTARATHDTEMASIDGRPAAVSVMLVKASTPRLQPAGVAPIMVSIRFLDRAFLAELEHSHLIAGPRFSAASDVAPGEEALPLDSEDTGRIGYLIWRPELPGSRILSVLGPTTAFLALAMVVLMLLLGRWLRRATGELSDTLVQLRASEAQAHHLAFHDPLTGLPNRALFRERLEHALSRTRRRDEPLSVLLLDLDRFKRVNDTLGHMAGDELIREFGARVAALLRDCDTVARLGGDEFAILLPGVHEHDELEALCRSILAAVRERFKVLGGSAFVGVSIGMISAPESGTDRVEIMRKADIALYSAKAEGRDCFRYFTECMDQRVQIRNEIEHDLRLALAAGDQLRLFYQPEIGMDGKTIEGLEALVRWQHPTRGLISPEQFIPIAEESGLICQLGDWVVGQACGAARRWPNLFIAVNLSPVQFRTPGFAEQLIALVRGAGVTPAQIELEVTEGVLLDDEEMIHAALAELRGAGFRIALDDFGTGYSSFSYLRRFRFDKIKIDRSFIQHLGHQVDSAALVTAVVTIGHAMGMTITAEGVETVEQKAFLADAGCNQMQGFLFSRPIPEEEVARLLVADRGRIRQAA